MTNPAPAQPSQPSAEDVFRGELENVIAILEKLAPFCRTPEEMAGMAELALKNDGQLRTLMDLVTRKR